MNAFQVVLVRTDGSLFECESLFPSEFVAEIAAMSMTISQPDKYLTWKVLPITMPSGKLN